MADPDYGRIKRNIAKMISLGAPESDIDAYVSSEGVTPDQLRTAPSAPLATHAPKDNAIAAEVRKELASEPEYVRRLREPSLARRAAQGMTFGFADEILAGMATPVEMVKRGTWNPAKAYQYAKAREDILLDEARNKQGVGGHIAEGVGGLVGGVGALRALPALPAGASLAARVGRVAAEGAAIGGLTGAGEASGAGSRASGALTGAAIGAASGPAVQGAAAGAGALLRPAASAIRGWMNPEGYARTQLAQALQRSGRTAPYVAADVLAAQADNQGGYMVADALGNPGQRLASVVARNPGAGRTALIDALNDRQAGQSRRVAQFLSEGFAAPRTAAQETAARTAARRAEADTLYGAARQQAGSVDVTPALAAADDFLRPASVNPGAGIAEGGVAGAVRRARGFLADDRGSQVADFQRALYAKQELDAMIEGAEPSVQRALIPIRNALDDSLANASPPYATARDAYRAASRGINAVEDGSNMFMRGRTEDTIPRFAAMSPDEQAAARVGYADPAIERVQAAAQGVNTARPFTSSAYQAEFGALAAPGRGEQLARRLGRENVMFETRNQATQGSRTADNLADVADVGLDPAILANLIGGNWVGAARNLGSRVGANVSGNTEATRDALARLLMMRGSEASNFTPMMTDEMRRQSVNAEIARALLQGARAGSAYGGARY